MSQSFSFSLEPGQVREVHEDSVAAFDEALGAVGKGEVNHFIDPQRLKTFEGGGPPVWSVATVPTDAGVLYLTYGFSEGIDPQRVGIRFELSIVVPGEPAMWPALFLRALCRYMLQAKRPLEVGQSMSFPAAITRFFAPDKDREAHPHTDLDAAIFADDPLLPKITTDEGTIEVRRVVGLLDDERRLLDLWTAEGFLQAWATHNEGLATPIDREPLTADAKFVEAIEAGSVREGSDTPAIAVPGVQWGQPNDKSLHVALPGGAHAQQIHRMVKARLPFERHLLVHDVDPSNERAVAFEPAKSLGFRTEGDTLVITVPADHDLFDSLLDAKDQRSVQWQFG